MQIKYAHTYLDRETMKQPMYSSRKKKERQGPHTNTTCASVRRCLFLNNPRCKKILTVFSVYKKNREGAKVAGAKKMVGHPCPLPVFPYL